jgi:predicted oxidoreductase
MTWGVWGHNLPTTAISSLIDHCLAVGIDTFDHADIYGHYTTEAAFGQALRQNPGRRNQMKLISKCGIKLVCKQRPENHVKSYDTSKAYIIKSVEQSLQNLGTDYLDLLLIHRPNPLLRTEEVAAAVHQLKSQGKILHFGASNFSPAQFTHLNQYTKLVTNQLETSLLHTAPMFDGTFNQCLQLGIKPMAWSPLGGLFKKHDDATNRISHKLDEIGEHYGNPGNDVLLLAWLLHHPAGILPVLGTARHERISAAVKALDIQMDDQHWFELLEAASGKEVA